MNIPNDAQVFLLNLFFVFMLYYVFYNYIEKVIKSRFSDNFFIFSLSALAIILCMTFSTTSVAEFNFDMRQIPLIIGALYGGRRVALSLLIVLLSYRFFIGFDTGFYASLVIYILLYFILIYFIPRFMNETNTKERIKIALLASICGNSLLAILLYATGIDSNLGFILTLFVFYGTQTIGIVLFVTFIERAKKDQLLVDEIKKLEKLKIVSDIAASISHEVRNPLTVTKGFLQLLREPGITSEKQKLYVELSLTELERAEATISDYLTFAKPSLENIDLLDLSKELDYIKKVISPYAMMHNVEVLFEVEDRPFIVGERQKLHQCLINIAKNGIEAMTEGGKLTVHLQQYENLAVVAFNDTGCGMDQEQVNRLGTPYYSTKDKGTGLGTMVVFSIVDLMGGHVTVDSKVGKGTCFTLSFPITHPAI
ncbi:HAMP domain-containing sensor histidine kinase [Bacillaceae bacterium IKA-2]|nr:HAMP domain-containing sensor histidine kinase [Bacillaceae bacterium IKA-2]